MKYVQMKFSLLIFFSFFFFNLFGQDTIYLDSNWSTVESFNKATYFKVLYRDHENDQKVREKTHGISGQLKSDISYLNYDKKLLEGKSIKYFKNGKIKSEIDYENDLIDGIVLTYWENGNRKRNDKFVKDNFIKGKCFGSDEKEIPHFDYQIHAEFPGGKNGLMTHLMKNLVYPVALINDEIEGKVLIKFIVDVDGSIESAEVLSSTNDQFNSEAIRVVKLMPKWKPAIVDGEAVKSYFHLPVRFALTD